ncbi:MULTISPECIES: NAD(+) diphosphatase [Mesorhizobium]|uniref:NAD(+) diphosphatase n=1 Tax=Mesorhizobium denitrificans TaxID=2294114 RepID=A0A371XK21_9HYPH|nr:MULTISPECIES: NAD(+) diphosphatase [Mesorhizobium]RFC69587.1 NAD(+) diphosphatase [Mesorhizobium denitrificans]
MAFRIFDAPFPEPSAAMGFAGNRIWRQSEERTDDSVALALRDPSVRALVVTSGRLCLKLDGSSFDPWFSPAEASALGGDIEASILLGRDARGPVLAVPSTIDPETLTDNIKAIDFRSINVQGLLEPEPLGALAQGAALLAWSQNHRFCARCGSPTEIRAGGYKRVCTKCGAEHFPRTDPVAIMLTVTQDHCLLGRGRHFSPGMYSALAGFIEPGETIEDAVRRETLEESGIQLGRVQYFASQPWPFPYSLMIGCFGEALNEDINADLSELEDCRWFTRGAVRLALEKQHPDGIFMPPKGAIAHHLIRTWVESD